MSPRKPLKPFQPIFTPEIRRGAIDIGNTPSGPVGCYRSSPTFYQEFWDQPGVPAGWTLEFGTPVFDSGGVWADAEEPLRLSHPSPLGTVSELTVAFQFYSTPLSDSNANLLRVWGADSTVMGVSTGDSLSSFIDSYTASAVPINDPIFGVVVGRWSAIEEILRMRAFAVSQTISALDWPDVAPYETATIDLDVSADGGTIERVAVWNCYLSDDETEQLIFDWVGPL